MSSGGRTPRKGGGRRERGSEKQWGGNKGEAGVKRRQG